VHLLLICLERTLTVVGVEVVRLVPQPEVGGVLGAVDHVAAAVEGHLVEFGRGVHRVEDDHLAELWVDGQPFRAVEEITRRRRSACPREVCRAALLDVREVEEDSSQPVFRAHLGLCSHVRVGRVFLWVEKVVVR